MSDERSDALPELAEPEFISGRMLAGQFYQAHEMEIMRASQQKQAKDRCFDYSAERFDKWLVSIGQLARPVRDAVTTVEGNGLSAKRQQAREKINRAARQTADLPRGFSIEGRNKKWRVVVAERYLQERPLQDADGMARRFDFVIRDVEKLKLTLADPEAPSVKHLTEGERLVLVAQLEGLLGFVLVASGQLLLLKRRIESNRQLDMRKLAKGMTKLLNDAFAEPAMKGGDKPKSA